MAIPVGFEIIINDHRIKGREKRTLKERFFTRPWRPFKKYKEIDYGPVVPDGKAFYGDNKIFVNSKTFTEIKNMVPLRDIPYNNCKDKNLKYKW